MLALKENNNSMRVSNLFYTLHQENWYQAQSGSSKFTEYLKELGFSVSKGKISL